MKATRMLDGSTVLVDSNVKADPARRGRLNFTIIHEASHHILKLLYPSEYGITQKTHYYRAAPHIRQTPITDWEEWQANTLAAAILLPPELVRAGMETVGLGERIRFIAINDGFDSDRKGDIDSLDTSFKTLIYNMYSRDLSKKVRSAKKSLVERAVYMRFLSRAGNKHIIVVAHRKRCQRWAVTRRRFFLMT